MQSVHCLKTEYGRIEPRASGRSVRSVLLQTKHCRSIRFCSVPRQQTWKYDSFCSLRSTRKRRIYPEIEGKYPHLQAGKGAPAETEEVLYQDSWTDILFIALCRIAYGNISGFQSKKGWIDGHETFQGMVEVSHSLMQGRSSREQHEAVIKGFPEVADWFRALFPYSKWGAELNAKITPTFFNFLVGPMETIVVDIPVDQAAEGAKKDAMGGYITQKSGVHIKKCRYLNESSCTGMCVNLCKIPTQEFFTNQLGMPLYMHPNFEDYSCTMTFGQRPPPLDEDSVMQQSCLSMCASSSVQDDPGSQPPCKALL